MQVSRSCNHDTLLLLFICSPVVPECGFETRTGGLLRKPPRTWYIISRTTTFPRQCTTTTTTTLATTTYPPLGNVIRACREQAEVRDDMRPRLNHTQILFTIPPQYGHISRSSSITWPLIPINLIDYLLLLLLLFGRAKISILRV